MVFEEILCSIGLCLLCVVNLSFENKINFFNETQGINKQSIVKSLFAVK